MVENLPDEYVRRQFYVIGLGNRLGDVFVNELNKSNRDSRAILLEMLPEIFEKRPLSKIRSRMLEDLADEVSAARGEYITRYRIGFEAELARLVAGEYKKSNEAFSRIPLNIEPDEDPALIIPLLFGVVPYDGLTLDQWFEGFREADRDRIYQSVSAGVANGETPEAIAQGLIGTKSQSYRDGDLNTSQNSARTLARTVTAGVAVAARSMWAKGLEKKSRINLLEVYSAILDSRTTFLCSSLSGNIYEVGVGPYPPIHRSCRSSRYPIPSVLSNPDLLTPKMSAALKGKDFAKDAKRRVGGDAWDAMSKSQRSAAIVTEKEIWIGKNIGTLPENLDFEPWFSGQPEAFKRDYLGRARYSKWKDGGLDIGDFVAPSGSRYTIEQLEKKGIL